MRPQSILSIILVAAFLAAAAPVMAGPVDVPHRCSSAKACRQMKQEAWEKRQARESVATDNIDVVSYTLDMDLDFDARTVSATCAVGIRAVEAATTEFTLDFVGLTVTGIMEDGVHSVGFTHEGGELRITPSSPMGLDEERLFAVTYSGTPLTGLFFAEDNGGLSFTFSQPEDARYWFPCRDIPADKADWFRGAFTAPSAYLVASNGDLENIVDNGNGTRTHNYFHDYPISTYLISFGISDYETFSQTGTGGVPINYFIYEGQTEWAEYDWGNVPAMMDFYSSVYDAYPFPSYGHACAPFGGAMEHQTMTTFGPQFITGDRFWEPLVAHELAHMWWGDMVTCETWADIWLNEGFATYFDALFTEHMYGETAFQIQMLNNRWEYFSEEPGEGRFPIYDPVNLWGSTVYEKGSWILHMLRHHVGEATWVDIVKEWADRYRYDTATTAEFIEVCEEVHGDDLDWFFDQWVYHGGYPEFSVDWWTSAGNLFVRIDQIQTIDEVTPLFTTPVDLRVLTPAGTVDTTVQVDGQTQTFILNVTGEPSRVIIDPDNWLLFKAQGTGGIVAAPGPAESNACYARVFTAHGLQVGPDIVPYGVDRWGATVGAGDLDGDGWDEVLTGPGPGGVFGPHVRGFETTGQPLAGLSFLAYGTHKYGVKVTAGDLDGDGFDEVVTGAGPGVVFGPHVRGFDYDGGPTVTPLPGVSYLAYGTNRWGVNVAAGDIDGDGYDEIVTGAGPGEVFGAHVRGWNVDNGAAAAIPAVSFFAYNTPRWGVNVTCGDIDADGMAEIITAPGPGPSFPIHIRAFDYDGEQVTPISAVNVLLFDFMYGAQVGSTDVTGDGADDIMLAPGPDPAGVAGILVTTLSHQGWMELVSIFLADEVSTHGATLAGGRFIDDARSTDGGATRAVKADWNYEGPGVVQTGEQ